MELMKLMEDFNGYIALSDVAKGEGYERKLTETMDLLSNAKNFPRHKHEYLLREALTTSDFPYLFGDVLDRQVLAYYKVAAPSWQKYVRKSTVPRIYPQIGGYRFAVTGGDQYLSEVAEKGEYLASDRDETRYTLYVRKYGRQFDISWEALINDDLNALKDTPQRFARAAVRTEERIVINQYADDWGLHSGGFLYDDTTANEVNGTVALLTIANLEAGLEAMTGWLDTGGSPIFNRAKYLVVPPALEMTARQILTSSTKQHMEFVTRAAASAATLYPMPTANVVAQMGLELIVEPWLPIVDTSNGDTGWYLFSDPSDIAALEAAHLSGHERPEICMKASDKVTVGGGALNPMSGDFATDNVFYRVRLVFGVCELDWRATYGGGLVN